MGNSVRRLVFQPPLKPTYGNHSNLIWLRTASGENIPSYFMNRGAPLTLLVSHGNAEDLGMIISYFKEAGSLWNINVFAYEYIGYGLSTGSASEAAVYESIDASFRHLIDVLQIPASSVVLYGRSLGTGACCHLASQGDLSSQQIRGVVLQSPLLSIHRVGLPLRFSLPGDMFCNVDKIKYIKCPVFIIHGTKDEIVPVYHGMALYNLCKNRVTPFWVEGAGHNNLEALAQRQFFEHMSRFFCYLELLTKNYGDIGLGFASAISRLFQILHGQGTLFRGPLLNSPSHLGLLGKKPEPRILAASIGRKESSVSQLDSHTFLLPFCQQRLLE